ncbi:MAG TPA: YIP1 family protein [Burkholderiales bacterium]
MGSNPTLSAIPRLLPSLRIIYSPTRAWEDVRAAQPSWMASLLVQVLPFAALCAVPWPSSQTVFLSLAAVVILALGFFALAPWFDARRSWNRSMAVAAYASTPVLLSWFLLTFPPFAIVPVVALLHSFALAYLGVQQLLDCRESEASLLVAAAWVFSAFGSMLLGGLCSAAGVL